MNSLRHLERKLQVCALRYGQGQDISDRARGGMTYIQYGACGTLSRCIGLLAQSRGQK